MIIIFIVDHNSSLEPLLDLEEVPFFSVFSVLVVFEAFDLVVSFVLDYFSYLTGTSSALASSVSTLVS